MFEPESNYDETFSLEEEYEKLSKVNRSIIDKILLEAKVWKYTPYKLGGSNQNTGGDCSSFVRYVFNNAFGIILARSTAEQRLGGVAVSKKNLKAGDLVFFKTGRGRNGMHVGIYLEKKSFIHLSSKGGTRVQNLDSKYWKNRYLSARRYNGVK
ncbi:C40 family peptidase [Campylobacter sp. MG1]|uniref:C40 family peptidase n=1 Tax=Campylobacter sp. MG1 TaxID=2976332 RepID=UPI00226CAEEE|nr:NlpC/P60 family protein [Campylobacter sp. MG1]